MGTKLNPGESDCYAKALPDEPMFVLLARDPQAVNLVRRWAYERWALINTGIKQHSDIVLVEEALRCAEAMEKWCTDNNGKWREPAPLLEPIEKPNSVNQYDCDLY